MDTFDRSLRYFLHIAELGSISKAADNLEQTQSGLSKHLAALERMLDKPLFTRTGRGVELTEVGVELFKSLSPAYQEIDRSIERLRQHGITYGTVRLATVHTLSYYFTADVVAQFVSSRPQANLSLLGRSSSEVVEMVDKGKADLGFVYDVAVNVDTLDSRLLFEDEMCLIVRRENLEKFTEESISSGLQLVVFPHHYALRKMIHTAGLKVTYMAEAETVDAMLQLVASGVGECILPSRIPDKLLSDYGLYKFPLNNPALRRKVVAITRSDTPPSLLTMHLLKYALQTSREISN
ncbi:LysR family transcriptional regulator [Vibrio natriegens]|uniref:LysR family transcriptional regulator n=1 Tax=Vibrio natriegens TaxID=691 RepID=UPI0021E81BC7|nr:LysR family transcriptional regulator [Vibrio natriegens]UYI47682.1 LysR family transcriptional regulator [Vibrio natriegens]